MVDDVLHSLVEAAATAYDRITPNGKEKALISDPGTPAIALLIAARRLLGPEVTQYEPETLWLEFDPPPVNRDKLLAAIALDVLPSFYWDYRVFGQSVLAFNDRAPCVGDVPHPSPTELAWGVLEGELIANVTAAEGFEPFFDPKVEVYVATALYDAGFVLAPEMLAFCDDYLKELVKDKELREEVSSAWEKLDKDSLDQSYDDTAIGVQLARLAEAHLYLVNRASAITDVLRKL